MGPGDKISKYSHCLTNLCSITTTASWKSCVSRSEYLVHISANLLQAQIVYPELIPSLGSLQSQPACVPTTSHELGVGYPLLADNTAISVTHKQEASVVGSKCVANLLQQDMVGKSNSNREVAMLCIDIDSLEKS